MLDSVLVDRFSAMPAVIRVQASPKNELEIELKIGST